MEEISTTKITTMTSMTGGTVEKGEITMKETTTTTTDTTTVTDTDTTDHLVMKGKGNNEIRKMS